MSVCHRHSIMLKQEEQMPRRLTFKPAENAFPLFSSQKMGPGHCNGMYLATCFNFLCKIIIFINYDKSNHDIPNVTIDEKHQQISVPHADI